MILPLTKGPIELALALMEQGHYPPLVENRLKAIGLTELPAKMSLPRDAVLAEYIQVRRQHETHTPDEAIARAIARVAWRIHAAPRARPEIVRRIDRDRRLLWAWRVAILLGVLGILGLLLTRPAKAQIDVIKFKDSGGATLKTFGAPFTIQCSTNITCTATGSTMAISASSTASTAWSSLSAGLNSNLGTFSVSGNTWDFSGSTLFKLRVGASCTTSANGDSCHDSTTGRWHFWVNGADRFMVGLTNVGASGQVPISNADGTATFADPIVSPNQDAASTAAWTSATALNAALSVSVSQRSTVTVSFNGTSITGGAVTFEASPDNTTWYAKAGVRSDVSAFESAYTLTGANQSWTFAVAGYTNFRVRLSTMITGAGTANINVIPQALGSPNLGAFLAAQSGTWTVQPGNTANTTAWKVDGSAVTQPISAASLPLPTGAATAAKQPALGTAGTPSADVISVQGAAGMTAMKVDGSAVTQPVSGTITANQGTAAALSAAWPTKVTDGTNLMPTGDAAARKVFVQPTDGTNNLGIDPCQNSANTRFTGNINQTAGAQIITGTASKQTYICSFNLITASAQNVALVEGTGAVCATATAGMAGGATAATGWNLSANGGLVSNGAGYWVFKTATAADNVCLLQSGTGQSSGSVTWVQQ